MLKNAALVAVAAIAVTPSLAHAEFQSRKTQAQPRMSRANAIAATSAAMNAALTVDKMVDKINTTYITGLRRCYNKGLAVDPSLQGKVTVTFAVSPYGYVSGEATGISKQVDSCVASLIKSWRFGRPSDKREANYRISLALTQ